MSTTEPPVTALRSYMRATGWAEGMQGSLGSVFTRGGVKVAVPLEDYDQDLTRISLNRLAQAEGRTPEDTTAAVLAHRDGAVSLDDGECDRLRALMAGRGAETDAAAPVVPVTDEHVRIAFTGVMDYQKGAREAMWSCPSTGQVRAMLEAVAPVLVAAERERAEATIAAVRDLCRSIPTPIAERILAVTGDGRSDEGEPCGA